MGKTNEEGVESAVVSSRVQLSSAMVFPSESLQIFVNAAETSAFSSSPHSSLPHEHVLSDVIIAFTHYFCTSF